MNKLIYKGRYASVSVENVRFVRGVVTEVPADLFLRIQEGEKNVPVGQPHEFVLPEETPVAVVLPGSDPTPVSPPSPSRKSR